MREITGLYFVLDDELISSENFNLQFLSSGLNVYEVLRFVNSTPLFFDQHFRRLMNSAQGKKLCHSITAESLLENIHKLISANKEKLGNIKIVLHSEKNLNCGVYIYQTPHNYPTEKDYVTGIKMLSLNEGRPDPIFKTWRPLFKQNIAALKSKFNAYDILLIDNGLIREGSQSNFFAIFENKILTAPGKMILKGITREIVFQICNEENIIIEEVDFSMTDLKNAQAIFLTGTSPGILPICQLDELQFSTSHPILKILLKKYKAIIHNNIKKTNEF